MESWSYFYACKRETASQSACSCVKTKMKTFEEINVTLAFVTPNESSFEIASLKCTCSPNYHFTLIKVSFWLTMLVKSDINFDLFLPEID